VVAVQKHHLVQDKFEGARVAIAVPKHLGASYLQDCESCDIAPKEAPGRAAAVWIAAGRRALYVSIYLWAGEGMSFRSQKLLVEVMRYLVTSGLPWILAGDFQRAPKVFGEEVNLQIAEGALVAPTSDLGACRGSWGNSGAIDYIIVCKQLASGVQSVWMQEERPSAPHKPVELRLSLRVVVQYVRVLVRPQRLDGQSVVRAPQPPEYEAVKPFTSQAVATAEYARVVTSTEKEAFALMGPGMACRRSASGERYRASLAPAGGPLAAAAQSLEECCEVWQVASSKQLLPRPWLICERPPMELSRLKEVIRGFEPTARIGVDRWRPGMLRGVSNEGLQHILDISHRVERTLIWPEQTSTILYILIPKTFKNDRWAGPPSTQPGRLLAREGGGDRDVGPEALAAATAILDLVKAFERVSLHILCEQGVEHAFPLELLAVVVSYFSMAMRLQVRGPLSEAVGTVAAIIAGNKFSVALFELIMTSAMDSLVLRCPLAKWRVAPAVLDKCTEDFGQIELALSLGAKGVAAQLGGAAWLRKALE
ncbi:unnamed protein product, partial [Prorocentrum cordatum]